jgi:hypothetical protein
MVASVPRQVGAAAVTGVAAGLGVGVGVGLGLGLGDRLGLGVAPGVARPTVEPDAVGPLGTLAPVGDGKESLPHATTTATPIATATATSRRRGSGRRASRRQLRSTHELSPQPSVDALTG